MPSVGDVGSVYFIQEGRDGCVKIGWTMASPMGRLKTLQVGNSEDLHLIGVLPKCSPDVELHWHHKFRHCHRRLEWFWPTPELLNAIRDGIASHVEAPNIVWLGDYATSDTVRAWLKANRTSLKTLSERCGYSAGYLRTVLSDDWHDINARAAYRIEAATGGEIKAQALMRGTRKRNEDRRQATLARAAARQQRGAA